VEAAVDQAAGGVDSEDDQSFSVIGQTQQKANALGRVAQALHDVRLEERAAEAAKRALALAEDVYEDLHDEEFLANALMEIPTALGREDLSSLQWASQLADQLQVPEFKVAALMGVAEGFARVGEPGRAKTSATAPSRQ
jgi:hypothetical protein